LLEVASADTPGWRVRVVPNRFAAVDAPGADEPPEDPRVRPAGGVHEVIIETPHHDAELCLMDEPQIVAVATAYRDRCKSLIGRPAIEAVVLFRNRGRDSGASLGHPHAQALALTFTPPMQRVLIDEGARRFQRDGCCATCMEIEFELAARVRIIEETPGFVALVPFAPEHPGEVWIAPRRHQSSLAELDDHQLAPFAALLRRTLLRLRLAYDEPSYNFAFDGADRAHMGAPFVHWRLRIVPKLAEFGGFELGAGIAINPSSPEADAARLRAADGGEA
jgi:UDPglucose--hexose-1-phosphate uridylyltransferase